MSNPLQIYPRPTKFMQATLYTSRGTKSRDLCELSGIPTKEKAELERGFIEWKIGYDGVMLYCVLDRFGMSCPRMRIGILAVNVS